MYDDGTHQYYRNGVPVSASAAYPTAICPSAPHAETFEAARANVTKTALKNIVNQSKLEIVGLGEDSLYSNSITHVFIEVRKICEFKIICIKETKSASFRLQVSIHVQVSQLQHQLLRLLGRREDKDTIFI